MKSTGLGDVTSTPNSPEKPSVLPLPFIISISSRSYFKLTPISYISSVLRLFQKKVINTKVKEHHQELGKLDPSHPRYSFKIPFVDRSLTLHLGKTRSMKPSSSSSGGMESSSMTESVSDLDRGRSATSEG
jgi:hypothetical protein